jgi:hypothetical protein
VTESDPVAAAVAAGGSVTAAEALVRLGPLDEAFRRAVDRDRLSHAESALVLVVAQASQLCITSRL